MILPAIGPAIIIELPEDVLPLMIVDMRGWSSSFTLRREPLKSESDGALGCKLAIAGSLRKLMTSYMEGWW